MQEFWIETTFLNEIESANTQAIKVYIPNNCPICSFKIEIADKGDMISSGCLKDCCEHITQYTQLYEMRIEKTHDPINDGCKCERCTEWVPMAQPNLPSNKFKCYRCRTHPLSL